MLPLLLLTLLQGPAMGKMAAPAAAVAAAAAVLHCFATDAGAAAAAAATTSAGAAGVAAAAAAAPAALLLPCCTISLPWPLSSAAGTAISPTSSLLRRPYQRCNLDVTATFRFGCWFSLGYGRGHDSQSVPLPPSYAKASWPWAYRATPTSL